MRSGKEEGSGYYEPRDWYPYDKAMELLEGKGLGGIYRRRLKAHLEKRDERGVCIMEQAPPSELEVGCEIILDRGSVRSREQALLGAFQDQYGELPKCNSLQLR